MYHPQIYTQLAFTDFDQPVCLKRNPEKCWIKKAVRIPWIRG